MSVGENAVSGNSIPTAPSKPCRPSGDVVSMVAAVADIGKMQEERSIKLGRTTGYSCILPRHRLTTCQ